VLLHRRKDGVRIEAHLLRGVSEQAPFNVKKPEEQMIAGQGSVIVSARGVDGSVDHSLRCLADLADRDIEISDVHIRLRLVSTAVTAIAMPASHWNAQSRWDAPARPVVPYRRTPEIERKRRFTRR
jgi:hypothetical protein